MSQARNRTALPLTLQDLQGHDTYAWIFSSVDDLQLIHWRQELNDLTIFNCFKNSEVSLFVDTDDDSSASINVALSL